MAQVVIAVVFLVVGCGGHTDYTPHLDSVNPTSAKAGGFVMLLGENFCGVLVNCTSAAGQIQIGLDNPVRATILSYNDGSAQIQIPTVTPAGDTNIVLTVNDTASNALDFEVLP
jgi:hypothetical protein